MRSAPAQLSMAILIGAAWLRAQDQPKPPPLQVVFTATMFRHGEAWSTFTTEVDIPALRHHARQMGLERLDSPEIYLALWKAHPFWVRIHQTYLIAVSGKGRSNLSDELLRKGWPDDHYSPLLPDVLRVLRFTQTPTTPGMAIELLMDPHKRYWFHTVGQPWDHCEDPRIAEALTVGTFSDPPLDAVYTKEYLAALTRLMRDTP